MSNATTKDVLDGLQSFLPLLFEPPSQSSSITVNVIDSTPTATSRTPDAAFALAKPDVSHQPYSNAGQTYKCLLCLSALQGCAAQGSSRECLYRTDHRTRKYRQTLVTERNERTTELDGLLHAIRTSSETEALEILRSLRSGSDVSTALKFVEGVRAQTTPILPPCTGTIYSIPQSKGPPAVLPLHGLLQPFDQATSRPSSSERNSVQWTTVNQNPKVISYLLDLYFTNHHPICPVIPEPLIRADMASGRTIYCSPALVNSILAVACTFLGLQDDVKIDNDSWPPTEAFFNETERLLSEYPEPNLTAVAALCLLAMVENLQLRRPAACKLSHRASCMALFLGFQPGLMSDGEQIVAGADEGTLAAVQQQLFWVCFQVNQIVSRNAGYLPQIPVDDFEIRPPDLDDIAAPKPWDASPTSTPSLDRRDRGDCWSYLADLAKIVHASMFQMESLANGRKGMDIRHWEVRYQAWYNRLPASLAVSDTAPAHVVAVHMWYHGCLIQSFRHVSTPEHGGFNLRALQICQTAAKAITNLFSCYRSRCGLRGFNVIMCQALLDAYHVHLGWLPSAIKDLSTVVEAFQELSKRLKWAPMWLKLLESGILHCPDANSTAMVEALFEKHKNTSERAATVQGSSTEKMPTMNHTNASITVDLVTSAAPLGAQYEAPIRPPHRNEDYFFSPSVRR
ncbi:hypothetical protein AYL99_02629 [Fonsecaea erecta]|uniref:Xylanolytic transcriptional activator regulatory domain-containing protein n=1 Tax=Fonsecaea erecta TaxID=1367422 RepID=A0A178ZUI9_9EURO|nr:hypothetical protein AYL99_02629 [Fonsecaea erecta]OAP63402.1 hypothetical protein AYL99_02629 [Fonsecaea erecta]